MSQNETENNAHHSEPEDDSEDGCDSEEDSHDYPFQAARSNGSEAGDGRFSFLCRHMNRAVVQQ